MNYCENCGAQDGESVKQNMERMGTLGDTSSGDVIYRVCVADRGTLCQFCQEHPNATRHYSPSTGVVVLSK